jgi:hypothetical protein
VKKKKASKKKKSATNKKAGMKKHIPVAFDESFFGTSYYPLSEMIAQRFMSSKDDIYEEAYPNQEALIFVEAFFDYKICSHHLDYVFDDLVRFGNEET